MSKSKTIETLVADIHNVLESDSVLDISEKLYDEYAQRMVELLKRRVVNPVKREPGLSISAVGKPCERQVWYGVNMHDHPEREALPPAARMKFLYGDFTEELILFLAEVAGHTVTGRQTYLEVEGVGGSRDAVIDGVLSDVKSASSYSFKKFQDGTLAQDDPFGYIGQIQTYLEGSQDDPLVTDKDRCAFVVLDKTLGHICVDIHERVDFDVREITRGKLEMVKSDVIPDRAFDPVPDGKSGNKKLGIQCSYCDFKRVCYPELRTFIYSNGPSYLTTVKREPNVLEVKN